MVDGQKQRVRAASYDPNTGIYQMGAADERRWKRLVWYNERDSIVYVTFAPPTDAFVQQYAEWIELIKWGVCYRISRPAARSSSKTMRTARGPRWGIAWPWPEGRARENVTVDDAEQPALF